MVMVIAAHLGRAREAVTRCLEPCGSEDLSGHCRYLLVGRFRPAGILIALLYLGDQQIPSTNSILPRIRGTDQSVG